MMRPTTRYLPPNAPNKIPAHLDNDWTNKELIPFLVAVWGEPHEGYWEESVRMAAGTTYSLPIYEDFESTVERFRLLLISPHTLTDAEMKDFGALRDDKDLCVAVFIRHFLNHGRYKLHSLGSGPNPDHPRQRTTDDNRHTYIYGGKMSRKRGDTHWTARKPNLQQHLGHEHRKTPANHLNNYPTKGTAPRVGKSHAPATLRFTSKSEVPMSINDRRRHASFEPPSSPRIFSARPFANPAFDGPGAASQEQPHMSFQGVARPVKKPMHMQARPPGYRDSSRSMGQPYTESPHRKNTQKYPALSRDNESYEMSDDYEQARPVGSSFISNARSYQSRSRNSPSVAPSSVIESSLPGFQISPRIVNPTFQPSKDAQHLRIKASDFVPGVNEHNF